MQDIIDISSDFFIIKEDAGESGKYHKNSENVGISSETCFYGGDQAWFSRKILRESGCSIIAATNVSIQCFLYAGRRGVCITKADYMKVATQVSLFLKPMQIFGISLGNWPASRFIKQLREFLQSIGERVEFSKFSPSSDTNALIQEMMQSLKKGIPPIMLIGASNRFRHLRLEYLDGHHGISEDAAMHWVTILGLYEMYGEYYLKTSSWGAILFIKLRDWQRGFWPSKILCMRKEEHEARVN